MVRATLPGGWTGPELLLGLSMTASSCDLHGIGADAPAADGTIIFLPSTCGAALRAVLHPGPDPGKDGEPRPASGLSDPFRARGAEPLRNLEASLCACIDAAGIRAETKIPSSALPQAGPVRSSERQEPHRPLMHGPSPYDSTGDEITLDEVERIRI
jgi:hypothetical protein